MRLLAALLIIAACGGSAGPAPSPERPSVLATPDPNLIDLMMGNVPQATAFVVSGREILAVTLLNHFVRYRLPVADEAQLVTSLDGARLYVVDRAGEDLRVRRFDVLTGELRAERSYAVAGRPLVRSESARGGIALGEKSLFVLREASQGLLVHAYDATSLDPLGTPAKNDGCARRILAAWTIYALLCPAGQLHVFWPEGQTQAGGIAPLPVPLSAAAISAERRIAVASANGQLYMVPAFKTSAERLEPRRWTKTAVGADGLAWADPYTLVVAETAKDVARPRVRIVDTLTLAVRDHEISHPPADGILAAGQFAFWVADDASGVYHVDLNSGLVEKMFGPLEQGARLGALAIR